jgi:hypothetical protein
VLRRLVPALAVALATSVSAGCADDVSPAARVGDVEITGDALMQEVERWASSPSLLGAVQVTSTEGSGPRSYSTDFVDVVLTNRIAFDLHREQFDALKLEVDDADLSDQRDSFAPVLAEVSAAFGDEVSAAFGDRLVGDLVRVNAVSTAMGDGYEAWFNEAISGDIEVNPRYGEWDPQSGFVVPPEGPRPAPGSALTPEL